MIGGRVLRGRAWPLVAALVGLLLLAGCGTSTSGEGFVGSSGSYSKVAPQKRQPAPALTGTTLDGEPFDSSTLAGSVIVVNVWGSWCAPCRKEAPDLQAAADRTAGTAHFVGINTRDLDPAPAQAFVRAFALTYPSLYDPSGELVLGLSDSLPASAIPSTLIIDAEGRVAARILGATTTSTLVGLITDVAEGR